MTWGYSRPEVQSKMHRQEVHWITPHRELRFFCKYMILVQPKPEYCVQLCESLYRTAKDKLKKNLKES